MECYLLLSKTLFIKLKEQLGVWEYILNWWPPWQPKMVPIRVQEGKRLVDRRESWARISEFHRSGTGQHEASRCTMTFSSLLRSTYQREIETCCSWEQNMIQNGEWRNGQDHIVCIIHVLIYLFARFITRLSSQKGILAPGWPANMQPQFCARITMDWTF